MSRYTHLSLFSGIGGLDLAAEWAGFETAGQCEMADYPTKVLEKHWPDVPRWRDIRTLTKESFHERTGLHTVDIISGGFPCQPFSVVGKQKGKGDDRYLWPEMLRIITEFAPRWVVCENVPGILRIAASDIIQDLERQGYHVVLFDFEAAAVGAPHRRERIAFVANLHKPGLQRRKQYKSFVFSARTSMAAGKCSPLVCNTNRFRSQRIVRWNAHQIPAERCTRSTQPRLGGMADGFSNWVDEPLNVPRTIAGTKNRANRIKAIGNAVVPQQFFPIFKAIAQELDEEFKGGGNP